MKFNFKEETKEKTIALTLSGITIVAFYFMIQNFEPLKTFLKNFIYVLMPFILGFFFAFLLSNISEKIEYGIMKSWNIKRSLKRKISVCLSILIFIAMLGGFIYILINQVWLSIETFLATVSVSMPESIQYLSKLIQEMHLSQELFDWLVTNSQQAINSAISMLQERVPQIFGYSWFVVTQVFNFFIALIVATYLLLDKEKFYGGAKKLTYAFLNKKQAEWLVDLTHVSSRMFNNFIVGKMIDSLIIGILCYIGMSILKLEFAVLISFIVGVTNIIPIFGPFIGAVPGFIILLITHPQNSLIFIIWILLLQQFDGNILGPRILGNSMGLPTIWIMFAIIVGGAYFGFVGMFLGVPVFAVFYSIITQLVDKRLYEKNIDIQNDEEV